jgi:hypothetical protein
MTNASKAQAIVLVNSLLSLAVLFGAPLSEVQLAGIGVAVNAALGLYVGLTYERSKKRLPEGMELATYPNGSKYPIFKVGSH